ncbi:MAG: hypothetical protein IK088_04300, partial [Lachnospiraceae bacterium]|nr:hypothetical protein [Lachnospiraceae bacterium]
FLRKLSFFERFFEGDKEAVKPSLFFTSALFTAFLVGFLIPSAVVRSSPAEFVDTVSPFNPAEYVISSGCLALGLFVVWLGVYYYLSTEKVRDFFSFAMLFLSLMFTVDYLFFGTDLGLISRTLRFDEQPDFSRSQILLNLGVCALVFIAGIVLFRKGKKIAGALVTAGVLTLIIMTAINFTGITREYRVSRESIEKNAAATIKLSKNGQNVVVLMLDKMISYYLPFIFEEKPELYEQFEGFTYYPNSVSYATKTNVATPGLYGGYEYHPEKINERIDEPLAKKQNEALRVMPVLFDQNGFDVTVTDPIYANYQEYSDLSVYEDYPDISAYALMGHVSSDTFAQGDLRSVLNRNFFCYGLMKVMPLFLQTSVYNYGNYNAVASYQENEITGQNLETVSKATGLDPIFMNSYNVLDNLPKITDCDGTENNTFLMFYNKTTHDTMMLQEPEYEPRMEVDNTEYDLEHHVKTSKDGRTIDLNPDGSDYFGGSYTRTVFYQINAAALLKLGDWFDYLRENGVYDNTRIILVSDHSWNVKIEPDMVMVEKMGTGEDKGYDLLHFNCVLMEKDFGSEGEMVTDDTFMTNCDVPLLATEGLIENPVNPFTGNELTDTPKYTEKLQLCYVEHWMVSENNGNRFMEENWFSVHDNIFNKKNWEFLGYY